MPLTPADKKELVQVYADTVAKSSAIILFDYRGLTVQQFSKLRNTVRSSGGEVEVIKNRLLKRVVDEKPYKKFGQLLEGPNAVVFAGEDPVAPAKALVGYAKENDKVKIRGGVVGDAVLDAKQVDELSKIPPMNVLQSKILGGIKAPATNVLGCIKGLHNKIHGLIKAYEEKLGQAA